MKKAIVLLTVVLFVGLCANALGKPYGEAENPLRLARVAAPTADDNQTYIDANRLLMFVTNRGSFAYDNDAILGKTDGLHYPKGTNLSVIYAGGLWLGGLSDGQLRVTVAKYSHDYAPGPIVAGLPVPDNPTYKVYKIYRELRDNGFYAGPRPVGDPAAEEMWDDYHNWPTGDGAPLDESFNPEIIGDQTLWCVFNDADVTVRTNSLSTSQGLGLEIQQTVFAYDLPGPLGDCIFMRYLIINESGLPIENAYAGFWADPDIGDAADDYVGCDSVMGIGYSYNATNGDDSYGVNPPAVGYYLLDVPGSPSTSLPMTAFLKFINGTDPDSPDKAYWNLQGMDAMGGGIPFIDPTNLMLTTYMHSGDPVLGVGWIDCCTELTFRVYSNIAIDEIAGPGGVPLDPPVEIGCDWNSTGNYYITSDDSCNLARMNWRGLMGEGSWEFRFTPGGSEYYDWNDNKYDHRAPFEVWNLGINTPDDPSDDVRIQFILLDDDESWDWSPGDRIYTIEREYYEPLPQTIDYAWFDESHLGRVRINDGVPAEGSTFRITATSPDTVWDTTSGDRRYLVSTGPFNLADTDTAEISLAVVVGQGTNRLTSVTEMKYNALAAREAFLAGFEICDCSYHCDTNLDGLINPVDVVYMVCYALRMACPEPPVGPYCSDAVAGDWDCSGSVNLADIVKMVNYVYRYPAPGPCNPCVE